MTIFAKGNDFEKPVIAWQRITAKNQFCLTKAGTVILDSMAFLGNIEKHKNYLLGVLNSTLVYFWIKTNVHEYGDTGFRLSNQYVELIPIPKENAQKAKIESLVKEALKNPSRELERKIDSLVYELYGLTEEEIAVVESV